MAANDTLSTEVLLVGAGPIGIEMAIALKRSDIDYLHVEAGCVGSTVAWYAPGTAFFSSPERLSLAGVPFETSPHYKATREDYLHYLRNIVKQFHLEISGYTHFVGAVKGADGRFECKLERSLHGVGGPDEANRKAQKGEPRVIRASKIILAVGDMHHPRLIGVPGEDSPNVSHFFSEPHLYSGARVLVVGGANSAAEAAIRLYRAGARATLIYRGEALDQTRIKPWVLPELRGLIRENKITFFGRANVKSINGEHIQIATPGGSRDISADFVLLLTGYIQDSSAFQQLGLKLEGEEKHPSHDPKTMETNVAGIYVIGTAVGGTQVRAKHFIETAHIHVNRVLESLGVRDYPDYSENLRPAEEREL